MSNDSDSSLDDDDPILPSSSSSTTVPVPPMSRSTSTTSTTSSSAFSTPNRSNQQSDDTAESSEDEDEECPLCAEPFDLTDKEFTPCTCSFKPCIWCWHNLNQIYHNNTASSSALPSSSPSPLTSQSSSTSNSSTSNASRPTLRGQCPGCRQPYTYESITFNTAKLESYMRSGKTSKKQNGKNGSANSNSSTPLSTASSNPMSGSKRSNNNASSNLTLSSSTPLYDIRVLQRNLLYIIGLSFSIAKEDVLKKREYFGKYGKIVKIAVNRKGNTNDERGRGGDRSGKGGSGGKEEETFSAYVTYKKPFEAMEAIRCTNGTLLCGHVIRCMNGTTKYCSHYIRGQVCPSSSCFYLHEPAAASDCVSSFDLSALERSSSITTTSSPPLLFPFGSSNYIPSKDQTILTTQQLVNHAKMLLNKVMKEEERMEREKAEKEKMRESGNVECWDDGDDRDVVPVISTLISATTPGSTTSAKGTANSAPPVTPTPAPAISVWNAWSSSSPPASQLFGGGSATKAQHQSAAAMITAVTKDKAEEKEKTSTAPTTPVLTSIAPAGGKQGKTTSKKETEKEKGKERRKEEEESKESNSNTQPSSSTSSPLVTALPSRTLPAASTTAKGTTPAPAITSATALSASVPISATAPPPGFTAAHLKVSSASTSHPSLLSPSPSPLPPVLASSSASSSSLSSDVVSMPSLPLLSSSFEFDSDLPAFTTPNRQISGNVNGQQQLQKEQQRSEVLDSINDVTSPKFDSAAVNRVGMSELEILSGGYWDFRSLFLSSPSSSVSISQMPWMQPYASSFSSATSASTQSLPRTSSRYAPILLRQELAKQQQQQKLHSNQIDHQLQISQQQMQHQLQSHVQPAQNSLDFYSNHANGLQQPQQQHWDIASRVPTNFPSSTFAPDPFVSSSSGLPRAQSSSSALNQADHWQQQQPHQYQPALSSNSQPTRLRQEPQFQPYPQSQQHQSPLSLSQSQPLYSKSLLPSNANSIPYVDSRSPEPYLNRSNALAAPFPHADHSLSPLSASSNSSHGSHNSSAVTNAHLLQQHQQQQQLQFQLQHQQHQQNQLQYAGGHGLSQSQALTNSPNSFGFNSAYLKR